jgi:hypothetical protein
MGALRWSRCPKPEMLLAYKDKALDDEEDRRVGDHLRICDRCREYLTTSREIGVLLRRHIPIIEDAEGLEELKRRLREPSPPSPIPPRFEFGRTIVFSLVLAALLVVGLVTTQTIEGGSSFTRWFSDDEPSQRIRPDDSVSGTPLVALTLVSGTSTLPLGLVLESGEPGQARDRIYRSASGLALSVVVEQSGQSSIYVDGDTGMTEIIGVNGREVFVSFEVTAAGRAVVIFYWIDEGQLVSVFVLEQPPGGLQVEDVSDISAALMTPQSD